MCRKCGTVIQPFMSLICRVVVFLNALYMLLYTLDKDNFRL